MAKRASKRKKADDETVIAPNEPVSTSKDDTLEVWDLVRALPSDTIEKCMEANCGSTAAASWATNLSPDDLWNGCENCQLEAFGGWPEDFSPSAKAADENGSKSGEQEEEIEATNPSEKTNKTTKDETNELATGVNIEDNGSNDVDEEPEIKQPKKNGEDRGYKEGGVATNETEEDSDTSSEPLQQLKDVDDNGTSSGGNNKGNDKEVVVMGINISQKIQKIDEDKDDIDGGSGGNNTDDEEEEVVPGNKISKHKKKFIEDKDGSDVGLSGNTTNDDEEEVVLGNDISEQCKKPIEDEDDIDGSSSGNSTGDKDEEVIGLGGNTINDDEEEVVLGNDISEQCKTPIKDEDDIDGSSSGNSTGDEDEEVETHNVTSKQCKNVIEDVDDSLSVNDGIENVISKVDVADGEACCIGEGGGARGG